MFYPNNSGYRVPISTPSYSITYSLWTVPGFHPRIIYKGVREGERDSLLGKKGGILFYPTFVRSGSKFY